MANQLLKASLKNGHWSLVKEIMRFISSIDPADFENGAMLMSDVFDFRDPPPSEPAPQQQPPPPSTSNQNTPISYKINKPTTATTTATPNTSMANRGSISSPLGPTTTTTTTTTPKTVHNSTSSVASTSGGRHRISFNEIELSRKSIESTIHEYALELLKAYRVRRLFEMFSQLGFLNINKWLEQYQ